MYDALIATSMDIFFGPVRLRRRGLSMASCPCGFPCPCGLSWLCVCQFVDESSQRQCRGGGAPRPPPPPLAKAHSPLTRPPSFFLAWCTTDEARRAVAQAAPPRHAGQPARRKGPEAPRRERDRQDGEATGPERVGGSGADSGADGAAHASIQRR